MTMHDILFSATVDPTVLPPAHHNLFGQHGPRCGPCSGLGRVLRVSPFDKVRSTSRCECKGTGVDLAELMAQERTALYQRVADLESMITRLSEARWGGLGYPGYGGTLSRQSWMELVAWATVDGTPIANSGAEAIVMPNITIPANYQQDGRSLSLKSYGRISWTTGSPTMRFRLRWGGVGGNVLWDSGVMTCTSAAVTNALWSIPEIIVQTRTNGATGTLFAVGNCFIGSAAAPTVGSATNAPAIGVFGSAGDDTPAAVTCDLTADTALSLTGTWSAASASNTLTGHVHELESKN